MKSVSKRFAALILSLLLLLSALIPAAAGSAPPADEPVALGEEDKQSLLSALYEADITSISEALDRGFITSYELTAYYLERIETYNEPYNCFITVCDNALTEAAERDLARKEGRAAGPLFGIPIVVKDNIDYEGYPTTNGYALSGSRPAASNAAVVQALIDAGAVILGKTNMSKGAQEARRTASTAVGETKNAYSTEMAAGGSSGGSAVAVSLNFAAAGLGTDTNSSLRYPSALNGCVSLRPTFGLIDRTGVVLLNTKRDTPGAITRTVRDQAILLDAMTGGNGYADSLNGQALSGVRLGILKELSGVTNQNGRSAAAVDKEVLAAFQRTAEELRACGAEIVEVSIPKLFTMASACTESESGASSAKKKLYAAFEALLNDNGLAAVIYPSYLHTPMFTGSENGTLRIYTQTYLNNTSVFVPAIGVPEITVPIGTHSLGPGIGLEITSLRGNDQLLLDLAYSYTERFDHRVTPDGAPNLSDTYHVGTLSEWIASFDSRAETTAEPEIETAPETEPVASVEPSRETAPADPITTDPTASDPTASDPTAPSAGSLWILIPIALCLFAVIPAIVILRSRGRHRHPMGPDLTS